MPCYCLMGNRQSTILYTFFFMTTKWLSLRLRPFWACFLCFYVSLGFTNIFLFIPQSWPKKKRRKRRGAKGKGGKQSQCVSFNGPAIAAGAWCRSTSVSLLLSRSAPAFLSLFVFLEGIAGADWVLSAFPGRYSPLLSPLAEFILHNDRPAIKLRARGQYRKIKTIAGLFKGAKLQAHPLQPLSYWPTIT